MSTGIVVQPRNMNKNLEGLEDPDISYDWHADGSVSVRCEVLYPRSMTRYQTVTLLVPAGLVTPMLRLFRDRAIDARSRPMSDVSPAEAGSVDVDESAVVSTS